MPTESDVVELLHAIGDRAPDADRTLDALSPQLRTSVPTRRARRMLAVAAAVVAVAGVGIGSAVVLRASDGRNTAAGYADAEPTTNHETYELPLDRYYASDVQWRTLQRAQFAMARRCAQERGVHVPVAVVPRGNNAEPFLSGIANNVRPLTLRQARAFGYDMYPGRRSALDAVVRGLDSRQRATYDQCDDAAGRALLRGTHPAKVPGSSTVDGRGVALAVRDDDIYVSNVYINEARDHSITPAVDHAQTRWSACMASHGYDGLRSTVDAIVTMRDLSSPAAKRQAVQDVKCKEATGFMTVWVEALREAQRAVIAKHRDALGGFEKRLKIRLANAAKALS